MPLKARQYQRNTARVYHDAVESTAISKKAGMLMYEVMVFLQAVSIIVLLVEIVYMIGKITSKGQSLMFLFILETLVNNIGYLLELMAESKETAIMGTKIAYMGKTFLLLTVFMYIMHFCKRKVPRWCYSILLAYHSFILLLVFASNKTALFYRSIDFVEDGLFRHLVMEKGLFYHINTGFMIVYIITMIWVLLRRLNVVKRKNERWQIYCLMSLILICTFSVVLFLFKLTSGYDSTAMGYLVSSLILLFGFFRHGMFNTLEQAKEFIVDNLDSGIVVLDAENNVLYYNGIAGKVYPTLDSEDTTQTISDIKQHYQKEDYLFSNDRVYQVTREDIDNQNEHSGQLYVFTDITDNYNYTERLKHDVETMTAEITRIQHAVITSFANMVEARDGATGLHIRNTSQYVSIVAEALREKHLYEDILSNEYIETLIEAAPLHDIGKIAISDSILCKPGKLTDEEFNIMKTHAAIGAQMIDEALEGMEENEYLTMARDMAKYHHEKWDGSGYPYGLKGNEIPLCARIMAIADVYDALRSKRCYKEGFSKEKALQIIKESSGTHFDPKIVEIFIENIDAIEQV